MKQRNPERNDGIEVDLYRLVHAVVKRLWVVLLAAVAGGAVLLVATLLFVTPRYQSSALFYVNNSNLSLDDRNTSMSSGDLAASRGLVESYIVILNTRETLVDVLTASGVDRKPAELADMIAAEAANDTEMFRVTVTSPDPWEAQKIAAAVAHILPKRISAIIDGTSVKVADAAFVPTEPSSPSYVGNTLAGLVLGLLVSMGVIVLRELFDNSIRTEADIIQSCDIPVLVAVPDMGARVQGCGKVADADSSVSGSEAYKLLGTKLRFSFADENDCRVIGVSSALTGEGKTLTAVNLAHTLARLHKKVLLLDGDLRRPTVFSRLPVQKMPGLSDFLTGRNDLNELIQPCGIPGGENAFSVICSGGIPSNPMELLSSPSMEEGMEMLRKQYDYIIVDLPPVGEVGDALAVSQSLDGFLLVVRQNGCSCDDLKNALNQLEFVDARVLGIVCNCAAERVPFGKVYRNSRKKHKESFPKGECREKDLLKK